MANEDTTPMADADYDAMEQRLATERARRAAAAAAERADKLKPVTDLVASAAWSALRAALPAAATAAIGEAFYDQVRALDVISGDLDRQLTVALAREG